MADTDAYQAAMADGADAAWNRDWARGIQAYSRALEIVPDDAQALAGLALCQMEAGRYNEAIQTYERVSQLVPGEPLPHEKIGEILEILGNPVEAAKRFLMAAEIYLTRKELQNAVPNWERAALLNPDLAQAHMRLALVYEREERTHHQAIYEYLQLARLLQQMGQLQRAEQALKRAQGIDAIDPEVRNALDDLRRGRPIQVGEPRKPAPPSPPPQPEGPVIVEKPEVDIRILDQAPQVRTLIDETARYAMGILADSIWTGEVPPAAQAPLQEALAAHQVGDAEGAISFYAQALRGGLEHPGLRFCLGMLYSHERRFKDTIPMLTPIADHPDYALCCRLLLGQAHFAQDELLDAARQLVEALRLVDRLVNGEVDEGGYERALSGLADQPREQLVEMVKALSFYLNDPHWHEKIERIRAGYAAQGKVSYVQDLIELILEGGRPDIAEIMQRVERYLELNQVNMAIEETHYAISRAPDYLPAHRRLADILIRQARTQDAVTKINLVASTYMVRGNVDKAADLFAEVIGIWPADTEARWRVIEMMRNQGRVPEALHHYTDLADLYYSSMADPEKAIEVYSEALDYARRSNAETQHVIPILRALGNIESERFNWRKALTYFERIAELDPGDEPAALAIVNLHFQLGEASQAVKALDSYIRHCITQGHAERVTGILEEQVRQRPDEIPLRQRLAEVYRQGGRTQEAVAQLDALGELLLSAGRINEAAATIRKIIGLNPPDVEGYRQLLQQLEGSIR